MSTPVTPASRDTKLNIEIDESGEPFVSAGGYRFSIPKYRTDSVYLQLLVALPSAVYLLWMVDMRNPFDARMVKGICENAATIGNKLADKAFLPADFAFVPEDVLAVEV